MIYAFARIYAAILLPELYDGGFGDPGLADIAATTGPCKRIVEDHLPSTGMVEGW